MNTTSPRSLNDALREDRAHIKALTAAWGMVADFCFGDLLFFTASGEQTQPQTFAVVAQVRPTTARTLYEDDLVGRVASVDDRPLLADAYERGEILDGQNFALTGDLGVRVTYIPVRRRTGEGVLRTVGVLTRELALDAARRPGRLERTYLEIFDALAAMIASGTFPPAVVDDAIGLADAPRVGDGVIAIGTDDTVVYASPNAMSALHRIGIYANPEGRQLSAILPEAARLESARLASGSAVIEIESVADENSEPVNHVFRSVPLLGESATMRMVVLVRDITDLRRRDRLLVTKDTQVREIHHRVKNNLQTISALLRLQGRRLESPEAKEAIEESVRRIRSIALVHETLSRVERDAVPFDEIVRPLVRMVEEGLASPERPIEIHVEGALGDLPPETATPLVVVLTELLQNAIDHAFPDRLVRSTSPMITVTLHADQASLHITVRDNGRGLPEGFSPTSSRSLGLSIVRTLVTSELGGAIAFRTDSGTVVELRVPRVHDPRLR